ncbi:hypothetical protein BD626DRAFT_489727 [Schizophyllum amplum]|uniref:Rhodopsin domain-containing protein n=1 Tax=Schizophyllum amplum TaxID=97359 RepID=A0A550CIT3_9AGAR|nr:hypothetical protein BD626DRAFT_489727 [Auriculariopsis ampla]
MAVVITVEQAVNTAITLTCIAIATTLLRLGIRIHDKKLGWDDFWAGFSIIASSLVLTGAMITLDPKPWMSQLTMVAGYYLANSGFYATIWSCRFSILCTIMRICPSWWMTYFRAMASGFAAMWMFLFVQAIVHCESDPSWKETTGQCSLGRPIAVAQLITDIIADLALSLAPMGMLWQSNLPKGQRVRLITVFASCFLTTLVSLAHAYCIWVNKGLDEFFSALFETSVSMVVASLSVLVGFFSRMVHGGYDSGGGQIHTSGATAASGFELVTPGRPINVDISTTVWVEDDAVREQVKRKGGRSVEDGIEDQKLNDQVYNGYAH